MPSLDVTVNIILCSTAGAINAANFIQSGGAVRIADCATDEGKGYGGRVLLTINHHSDSHVCNSGAGGLSAHQSLMLADGILDVRQSSSSYYGGARCTLMLQTPSSETTGHSLPSCCRTSAEGTSNPHYSAVSNL